MTDCSTCFFFFELKNIVYRSADECVVKIF
jgi:hypothetical protein